MRGAQLPPIHAIALSPLEKWVVDVGDVLCVVDLVAVVQQLAINQVKGEVRCRMTQVSGIVRRDATDVHAGGISIDIYL